MFTKLFLCNKYLKVEESRLCEGLMSWWVGDACSRVCVTRVTPRRRKLLAQHRRLGDGPLPHLFMAHSTCYNNRQLSSPLYLSEKVTNDKLSPLEVTTRHTTRTEGGCTSWICRRNYCTFVSSPLMWAVLVQRMKASLSWNEHNVMTCDCNVSQQVGSD